MATETSPTDPTSQTPPQEVSAQTDANQPQKEEVKESPQPAGEKKKIKGLYIVIIMMAIIALGLVGYIAYSEIFLSEEPEATQEEEEGIEEEDTDFDIEEEEAETETFTGDYVTAELPVGWSIVEYEDGDGTDMVTDDVDFVGLTGIEVLNDAGNMIFKIYAVYGIGGVDACDEYVQFEDFNEEDYDDIVGSSAFVDTVTELVDYTDVDYTEFTFFGLKVRRVNDELYWDSVEGETYFEPACNISYRVWVLEGLTFSDGDMDSSSYMWEISDTATEEELLKLDDILDSMDGV